MVAVTSVTLDQRRTNAMPYEKEIVDRLAAYCDAGYEIIQIERTLLVAAMDAINNQYECMHGYTIQDACADNQEEGD